MKHERTETHPEGLFGLLGQAGLLGLPYPEEFGGGNQPYEVYLQVLEELAAHWAAVAVAASVHSLAAFPLLSAGTSAQCQRWAEDILSGSLIGGYSLSEPQAGSDAAALTCRHHAVIEQVIADSKASALAHLPSGHFHANAAWLVLWATAYNLLRAAGALTSAFHAKATTATLRTHLVRVPARIARSARRVTLHLPQRWPWQHAWTQPFETIHAPPDAARRH